MLRKKNQHDYESCSETCTPRTMLRKNQHDYQVVVKHVY